MAKTAAISMRVDPEIKSQAEEIYESLGLTLTDAINMFLYKSVMERGLPFEVKQPKYNAETEAAIAEARAIMAGTIKAKRYDSVEEAFRDALAETDDEDEEDDGGANEADDSIAEEKIDEDADAKHQTER